MQITRSATNRSILFIFCAVLTILLLGTATVSSFGEEALRTSTDVKLTVNGKAVNSDVAPIIINERTMIPARAVFEQLGGKVDWSDAERKVTIAYNGHTVVLNIDSTAATVDGAAKNLDVPAMLYNYRTLIPIRFVAEGLGLTVGWDNATRTATITAAGSQPATTTTPTTSTPATTTTPAAAAMRGNISAVSVTYGTNSNLYTTVKVTSSVALTTSDYSTMTLSGPTRYVVDFKNFKGTTGSLKTFAANSNANAVVKSIRTAMHTDTEFRLVFDLSKSATPSMSLSGDKKTLFISFAENKTTTTTTTTPSSGTTTTKPTTGTTTTTTTKPTTSTTTTTTTKPTTSTTTTTTTTTSNFNPYSDGKLVVCLDPGHGASTAGKRSPDGTLREYELNRDIAYRIRDILKANGITVYMTVSDKTSDPSLASRVQYANNTNADIFVSVHANAFGDGVNWEDQATGWEIYYYPTSTTGKKLAQYIHDSNFPKTGTGIGIKDRGIKTANFYVIKYTSMPAVLIEHGFYTSKTEVKKLKSNEWRQRAAQLDAQGIMNFLKSYKK